MVYSWKTSALLCLFGVSAASGSDLWDYVHTPDPTYTWYDTGIVIRNDTFGWTGYYLNMTSQTWLTAQDSSRPVWTHQLVVVVPDNLKTLDTSAIYVTGGGNNNPGVPKALSEDLLFSSVLAVETGTICATLWQVPNQPIVFPDDWEHKERGEDALVAFTWWEFVNHQDRPEWIVYNAMVKSVVKAMDTVTAFAAKRVAGANINKFLIAGASKRGWTTWLTGAVDDRVIGIAPIVMDMLHFIPGVEHMYRAYGGWTFAFKDYYEMNITTLIGSQKMQALSGQIDPLNYAENLTMPKLVIDATGDEFFMPDDDWYWWTNSGPELPGETYRLFISNAEHSMATGVFPLITGVEAFYKSLLYNASRPQIHWTLNYTGNGDIHLYTDTMPTQAVMRFATTFDDTRRDFRLVKGDTSADPCKFIPVKIFGNACINPVLWVGEDIAPVSSTRDENGLFQFVASQPLPPSGWRAFFIDLYYPGPANSTYRFTSQISIIPNTFPFPPCGSGESCMGQLV